MKRIALLTIAMILPFMSETGTGKEGFGADSGKHFGEPASENIAAGMNRLADSVDNAVDTMDNSFRDLSAEAQIAVVAVGAVAVTCYAVHSAAWYAYHKANGTLDAELAKHKAEQEEAYQRAEEARVKQLLAQQEAQRLKRNAEIEAEFNACFTNRFNSPTRKRNGIPSSCEFQGLQLVSTGKFKSMQELREYYMS